MLWGDDGRLGGRDGEGKEDMKITRNQLRRLIKEARLPAWERPGYVPPEELGDTGDVGHRLTTEDRLNSAVSELDVVIKNLKEFVGFSESPTEDDKEILTNLQLLYNVSNQLRAVLGGRSGAVERHPLDVEGGELTVSEGPSFDHMSAEWQQILRDILD